MSLNCKPGDLAIVVRDRNNVGALGMIVEVLYAPPSKEFRLPDGYVNVSESWPKCWVVKLPRPLRATLQGGSSRMTVYGTAADSALRPIRDPGDDAQDETLSWLTTPSKETA